MKSVFFCFLENFFQLSVDFVLRVNERCKDSYIGLDEFLFYSLGKVLEIFFTLPFDFSRFAILSSL